MRVPEHFQLEASKINWIIQTDKLSVLFPSYNLEHGKHVLSKSTHWSCCYKSHFLLSSGIKASNRDQESGGFVTKYPIEEGWHPERIVSCCVFEVRRRQKVF